MNERQNNLIRGFSKCLLGCRQNHVTIQSHLWVVFFYTKPLFNTSITNMNKNYWQIHVKAEMCVSLAMPLCHTKKKEQVRMHSQALKYFYITCSNDTVIKVPLGMYIYLTINPAEPKISNNITQDCDFSALHRFNPYLYTCVPL